MTSSPQLHRCNCHLQVRERSESLRMSENSVILSNWKKKRQAVAILTEGMTVAGSPEFLPQRSLWEEQNCTVPSRRFTLTWRPTKPALTKGRLWKILFLRRRRSGQELRKKEDYNKISFPFSMTMIMFLGQKKEAGL